MTEIGWGFIGASIWARTRMIPAVTATPGASPVAVCSRSADRASALAAECGVPRAYDSLDALFDDPQVDVVYISSTNDRHAEHTIAAAAAGRHVLCEKPLATSVADAERMRTACRDAGVVLAANHHLRGAPTIVAMRRLIEDGAIGEPVAAAIQFGTSLPVEMRTWRLTPDHGGGVALDLTVHDADTLRFLLADEIAEVNAIARSVSLGGGRVEDTISGAMRTDRDVSISFQDSFVTPYAGTAVSVHGTGGSLMGHDVLTADPIGDVWLRRDGESERVEISERWPLYEYAVARFCAAVRGEDQPLCTGDDGVASLAVALAVLESAGHGRTVSVKHARA